MRDKTEPSTSPPREKRALFQQLWRRTKEGIATERERTEAAFLAGELRDVAATPQLVALLDDDAAQVRYYALQALVLDLHVRDTTMAESCWRLLTNDPDDDVRSMATTCIGNIYFGSRRKVVFQRVVELLKSDTLSDFVKGGLYSALFKLAGLPPREWPGLWSPRKVFEESDVDWTKIAELEAMMTEP